jgi:hypothetical protein
VICGSNYDKDPVIMIDNQEHPCFQGWPEVLARIERAIAMCTRCTIAIECYPGVFLDDLTRVLRARFGKTPNSSSSNGMLWNMREACPSSSAPGLCMLPRIPTCWCMQAWPAGNFSSGNERIG